jgi:transcriptional regulator with XRE-family HTH domain
MKLGEKIRYLREVEGSLRGLDREMTQQELVRAIKSEQNASLSQSYLSQIESGARPHLTNTTRMLLAKFFKVHPGYLVDDPIGYQSELITDLHVNEDKLDLWLIGGAERFSRDPGVAQALLDLARHSDTRKCLVLMGAIIDTPGLMDRLLNVLRPGTESSDAPPSTASNGQTAAARRKGARR